jgi:hypothetical protein
VSTIARGPTCSGWSTPPGKRLEQRWAAHRVLLLDQLTPLGRYAGGTAECRAGLVRLLPGRSVLGDLLLPTRLPVAQRMEMAPPQTPEVDLEAGLPQYCGGGWRPATLFDPSTRTIRWYRHRGTKIPAPGRSPDELTTRAPTALVESPLRREWNGALLVHRLSSIGGRERSWMESSCPETRRTRCRPR